MTTSHEAEGNMSTSRVWLVRAGRRGEDENSALEHDLAILGFNEVKNLEYAPDRGAVSELIDQAYPNAIGASNANRTAQLTAFVLRMQKDDIVVLPLKTRPGQIALGRVKGRYAYQEIEGVQRHTRLVEWVRSDVPRSSFRQDLLYSMGAAQTVCQIQRNEAESRIAAVLSGDLDPRVVIGKDESVTSEIDEEAVRDDQVATNYAEVAYDQVIEHIRLRFPGHKLEGLVETILQAEGYTTQLSPLGPDAGVDILAGRGPLAFEGPRICVQVKATAKATDVNVLRSLQGTMGAFQADQGLLVSWSGFTGALQREARQSFFTVRLWNANELVDAVFRNYSRLPEQIRAEIPLRRIWTLVPSEGDL